MAQDEQRYGWKAILNDIIERNIGKRNGSSRATSLKTQKIRRGILWDGFYQLRELGYPLGNPANFRTKHIQILTDYWVSQGQSPSTIQNKISTFRIFAEWLGKGDMIGKSETLVKDKALVTRTYAASHDKSLKAHGVDVHKIIEQVMLMDKFVGMQYKMVVAFGLRKQEAVMFRPMAADKGEYLLINRGTKGGRPRTIKIETDYQRQVIQEARDFILANKLVAGSISDPDLTHTQNMRRYAYVAETLGITKKEIGTTMHGERAAFAMDALERRGVMPSVRGGDGKAETNNQTDKAYLDTAEDMGHSRRSIMPAYAGAVIRKTRNK